MGLFAPVVVPSKHLSPARALSVATQVIARQLPARGGLIFRLSLT
jgi:hypothetical protein